MMEEVKKTEKAGEVRSTTVPYSTSLRSFVSCTGWRLQSGLHSNNQSSCTSVYTGPHLYTLLTSFVRWQMSRLVSDSVPVPLHHWLSAAPDSSPYTVGDRAFPVTAARVWNSLPDLVTSAPSVAVFRSRFKTHLFNISYLPLWLYSVSHPPPRLSDFLHFPETVKNFWLIFTRLLYVPMYSRLQIFIQLSPTLTKLCILSATT